jgi:hypothetical protein
MNKMVTGSIPLQPQCSLVSGVRDSEILKKKTHLGLRVNFPLFLSDFNQPVIMLAAFSKTPQ